MSRTLYRLKRESGISLKMPQWKKASSRIEERISDFLELRWETWGSSRVMTGISGTCSCCLRKVPSHASCEGPLRIPLQSVPGPRSSSGVVAKTSVFPSNADMDLGVPIEFQQWSQASSRVETCKFAFLSSSKSSVRVPVGLT